MQKAVYRPNRVLDGFLLCVGRPREEAARHIKNTITIMNKMSFSVLSQKLKPVYDSVNESIQPKVP